MGGCGGVGWGGGGGGGTGANFSENTAEGIILLVFEITSAYEKFQFLFVFFSFFTSTVQKSFLIHNKCIQ